MNTTDKEELSTLTTIKNQSHNFFSPQSPEFSTQNTKRYLQGSPEQMSKLLECFSDDQGIEIQEEETVCLQLWDTPGQETYRSLVKIYYRKVQAIVLVISLEDAPKTDRVVKQL